MEKGKMFKVTQNKKIVAVFSSEETNIDKEELENGSEEAERFCEWINQEADEQLNTHWE